MSGEYKILINPLCGSLKSRKYTPQKDIGYIFLRKLKKLLKGINYSISIDNKFIIVRWDND